MNWPTHIVAAAGYVFDKARNILNVKTHTRGCDCTGGQIEEGENIEEGVLREILEESGVRASLKCLCGIYSNVGKQLSHDGLSIIPTKLMMDFICEYESGELTPSIETSEVMWVPKEQVWKYISSPPQIYRFKKALAFNGRITYASYVSKPVFQLLYERMV